MWIAVKIFGYIICVSGIFLSAYGIYSLLLSADKKGNIHFNKRTFFFICCMLSLFIGGALIAFAKDMHQKEQAQNLKIVQNVVK